MLRNVRYIVLPDAGKTRPSSRPEAYDVQNLRSENAHIGMLDPLSGSCDRVLPEFRRDRRCFKLVAPANPRSHLLEIRVAFTIVKTRQEVDQRMLLAR